MCGPPAGEVQCLPAASLRGPILRLAVAIRISRRKVSRPMKKDSIAMTKRMATGNEASNPIEAPRKRTAITAHTSSAVIVQSVIARPASLARRDRVASCLWSTVASPGCASSRCSSVRARSMTRASRCVMTASIAPMPDKRNTGATASEMTCATAAMPVSAGIGGRRPRRREMPHGERDRNAEQDRVGSKPARDDRKRERDVEWRGRERYEHVVHEEIDADAEDEPRQHRALAQERDEAAREIENGGRTDRDAVVRRQAERRRTRTAFERGVPQPSGGDRLQCPLGSLAAGAVPDDRIKDVEGAGDESADENTEQGAPHENTSGRPGGMLSPGVDGEHRSLRQARVVEAHELARPLARNRKEARGQGFTKFHGERRHVADDARDGIGRAVARNRNDVEARAADGGIEQQLLDAVASL